MLLVGPRSTVFGSPISKHSGGSDKQRSRIKSIFFSHVPRASHLASAVEVIFVRVYIITNN